jgi:hypothetical protein
MSACGQFKRWRRLTASRGSRRRSNGDRMRVTKHRPKSAARWRRPAPRSCRSLLKGSGCGALKVDLISFALGPARVSLFERLPDFHGRACPTQQWYLLNPAIPSHIRRAALPEKSVPQDHSRHRKHRADAHCEMLDWHRPGLPPEARDHGIPNSGSEYEQRSQSY